jgi:serine/threonine protein phosphatase PrpC
MVKGYGQITIGRYGGTTATGAYKNEDAALIWTARYSKWTFAALLDAHGSSESANLLLSRIEELEGEATRLLDETQEQVPPLWDLSTLVTRHLGSEEFRKACAAIHGETALLLCAQKGAYLWWLSVGDIPVYVFHPEFARLGQFALNQRMFFEWTGQVNTFALPVPCYSTGVRQLRAGQNRVLLTTDGLLECGTGALENPRTLYDLFNPEAEKHTVADAVSKALDHVQKVGGRDSATLIAWDVEVPPYDEVMQPSD